MLLPPGLFIDRRIWLNINYLGIAIIINHIWINLKIMLAGIKLYNGLKKCSKKSNDIVYI